MAAPRSSKSVLLQKRAARRKWLTFVRMVRYGINNFSRNIWLTIAATTVMTVTLLVVFMTLATRNVLQETLNQIKNDAGYSIYLKPDTSDATVMSLAAKLRTLKSVQSVSTTTVNQAKDAFAKQHAANPQLLATLAELPNEIPPSLQVVAVNMEKTAEIQKLVKTDPSFVANLNQNYPPTFNNQSLQAIAGWGDFAEKAGIVASILFIVFSILIVFNTIRMAIFNRKEEIQMMKIIGADRAFIRGPFVVESIVYGFIAAILATALGFIILLAVKKPLHAWFNIATTIGYALDHFAAVIFGMILLGALVGIISSLLAVRRYLKI